MVDVTEFTPHEMALITQIAARVREATSQTEVVCAERLVEARSEALRLALIIGALDDVTGVIHFGSSATGRNFRIDSDIDLAVTGGDIFAAMKAVESSKFHVDVIDINRVPSSLKEAILKEGLIVYENTR